MKALSKSNTNNQPAIEGSEDEIISVLDTETDGTVYSVPQGNHTSDDTNTSNVEPTNIERSISDDKNDFVTSANETIQGYSQSES